MVTILSPMCRRSCYFQSFSFIPLLRWPEDEGFVLWPEDVYIASGKATFEGLWYTDYPCYPIRAFRLKIIHCLERVLCGLRPRT
jgi:hypothetical protein